MQTADRRPTADEAQRGAARRTRRVAGGTVRVRQLRRHARPGIPHAAAQAGTRPQVSGHPDHPRRASRTAGPGLRAQVPGLRRRGLRDRDGELSRQFGLRPEVQRRHGQRSERQRVEGRRTPDSTTSSRTRRISMPIVSASRAAATAVSSPTGGSRRRPGSSRRSRPPASATS